MFDKLQLIYKDIQERWETSYKHPGSLQMYFQAVVRNGNSAKTSCISSHCKQVRRSIIKQPLCIGFQLKLLTLNYLLTITHRKHLVTKADKCILLQQRRGTLAHWLSVVRWATAVRSFSLSSCCQPLFPRN